VATKLVDEGWRASSAISIRFHDSGIQDLFRQRHSADFTLGHRGGLHGIRFQDGYRVMTNDAQQGSVLELTP